MYVCSGVIEGCVNPDSYGEICVGCNQCGRFDKPAADKDAQEQKHTSREGEADK